MSSEKSDGRYSEVCGATNNRGNPCGLPAGWGTPGSQGGRCRFHGGCSDGPTNTDHLEGNDFAAGNPGGGAPNGNTNAEVHGGFGDWRKAYERFDAETQAYVDRLRKCMRETAEEHAPDVPEDRREELIKERATLSILWRRAMADTLGTPEEPVEGARGLVFGEDVEVEGETVTRAKVNPAFDAGHAISMRKREIAKELSLLPGYQKE
jgi:hypothetical protein